MKKLLTILVIGFAVYYLLTAPAGAAESIRDAFNGLLDAFGQIMVFVQELFGGQ